MTKIQEALRKCGISEDAITGIVAILTEHQEGVAAKYKADFEKRVEAAKRICVEETDAYKKELAGKVQICMESIVNKVEQKAAKNVSIREGQAGDTLKQLKALLEGVSVDKVENASKVKQLQKQLTNLQEENRRITAKAARQNEISNKILETNRTLTKQLAIVESKASETPIVESRQGRQQTKLPAAQATKSTSTRKLVQENVNMRPRPQARGTIVEGNGRTDEGMKLGTASPEDISKFVSELM